MDRVDTITVGGGIRLAFEVTGAPGGPPLVLLHGLGEGRASWAEVAARLGRRFRVYAFDLRGHGDSDWPGTYSYRLTRDDVLEAPGPHGPAKLRRRRSQLPSSVSSRRSDQHSATAWPRISARRNGSCT